MDKKAKIVPANSTEKVSLYTLVFENEDLPEFVKFTVKFKENSELRKDYELIIRAITKIMEYGALERYFRPEGKFNDGVGALPVDSSKLRLYCLRVSDKILFLGNGGEKHSRTYNENPELNGYVMDLQKFSSLLQNAIKEGNIVIEENSLKGYEDITFEL